MMRISVWALDLSDAYLKKVSQLGVDCLDGVSAPHAPGTGYPDLDELLKIRKRVRSWGLELNRVSLPALGERFIREEEGGEAELENCCKALQVYGEAGVPVVRPSFARDTFPWMNRRFEAVHRGGYHMRGESVGRTGKAAGPPPEEELERWWQRLCAAYEGLVPIAEEYGVKLAMHPSDTPNPDAPLGGLGLHRLIDAFPSRSVGYLYCCGTRAEAGGSPLILDEIHHYGRKGRIFHVHFRNVRGSLPTAGGFEEVLLDDGDMNMFKILLELKRVGFEGCLNPDHVPHLEGDGPDAGQGLAYSVGYIKALFAALATR